MKTIAMVKDGVVANTAKWDGVSEWNPGAEFKLHDVTGLGVGVGWTVVDGEFFAPVKECSEE